MVITGRLDDELIERQREAAAKYGLSQEELLLVGYVSDELLLSLYRSAALFVFPSLREGFGLPVLEAISCGAPTIASNTSSLPEVVGNAEALFDPTDAVAMSETMARGLTDADYRQRLLTSGRHQAAQFSWEHTAALALASLEMLAANKPCTEQRSQIEHRLPARIAERLADLDPLFGEAPTEPLAECLAVNPPLAALAAVFDRCDSVAAARQKDGHSACGEELADRVDSRAALRFCVVLPVYYDGDRRYRHANRFLRTFVDRESAPDELVDFGAGDVYLGLDFNVTTTPMSEELFRALARRGIRLCFVVYDMLPLLRPDWWPPEMSPKYEQWLRSLASVADDVCCISATVAGEVSAWIERTGIQGLYTQPAVSHFHLGADLLSSAPSGGLPRDYRAVRAALDNDAPTFLMVGTIEPRKGHAEVLEAFDQLWAAGARDKFGGGWQGGLDGR